MFAVQGTMGSMTHIHTVEYGNKDNTSTVVLLSSIATTHESWSKQIPELAKHHRVIAVDHRGHGGSDVAEATPGTATVKLLAQDILQALNREGVDRFSVVGLSLGGAIAQWLAAYSGRVDKAVFACTATYLGGNAQWDERTRVAREEGMGPIADMLIPNWFTPEFIDAHPGEVQRIHDMVSAIDPEGYAQNGDALAKWDFASHLDQITCPVLTIAATGDAGTGPDKLAEIADGVAGPVESVIIEPGSHQVPIENPAPFNAALLKFLG